MIELKKTIENMYENAIVQEGSADNHDTQYDIIFEELTYLDFLKSFTAYKNKVKEMTNDE